MSLKQLIKKSLARLGFLHPSLGVKISPENKAIILLKYKTPDLKVFVETGTEYGWMIEKIGDSFEQIYSIELDAGLFDRAQKLFQGKAQICLLKGDSAIEIKKILGELAQPALFWLDAHGNGEITADNAPIIKELEAIFAHPIRGHVILIDDARHFDRRTIRMIKKITKSHHYGFYLKDGIFRLTPKSQLPRFKIIFSVNRILSFFNLRLTRLQKFPQEFVNNYHKNLLKLKGIAGVNVFEDFRYDAGDHPKKSVEYECEFASDHLSKLASVGQILDIGSYRQFVVGLLAHFKVVTIDVRERKPDLENESMVTGDAKKLDLSDNSFGVITSLCSLEHFGLGRYGDDFDLNADKKAFQEMVRVLKPGGQIIFTTTINGAGSFIAFNSARIYDYQTIKSFCQGLDLVEEKFFSYKKNRFCSLDEVTTEPREQDIYCGCWKKPQGLEEI